MPLADIVVKTACEGLHLVPTDKNLVGANLDLVDRPQREFVLSKVLSAAADMYDYALIDCPPALDLLTLNALVAADSVLNSYSMRVFCIGRNLPTY